MRCGPAVQLISLGLLLLAVTTALAEGEEGTTREYTIKDYEKRQAEIKKKEKQKWKLLYLQQTLTSHQLNTEQTPRRYGAAIVTNPIKLFSNIGMGNALIWPEDVKDLKAKTTDEGRDGWKPREGDFVKVIHAWTSPVDAKLVEYTSKSGEKQYIVVKYEALTTVNTPFALNGTFLVADRYFLEKNETVCRKPPPVCFNSLLIPLHRTSHYWTIRMTKQQIPPALSIAMNSSTTKAGPPRY